MQLKKAKLTRVNLTFKSVEYNEYVNLQNGYITKQRGDRE